MRETRGARYGKGCGHPTPSSGVPLSPNLHIFTSLGDGWTLSYWEATLHRLPLKFLATGDWVNLQLFSPYIYFSHKPPLCLVSKASHRAAKNSAYSSGVLILCPVLLRAWNLCLPDRRRGRGHLLSSDWRGSTASHTRSLKAACMPAPIPWACVTCGSHFILSSGLWLTSSWDSSDPTEIAEN